MIESATAIDSIYSRFLKMVMIMEQSANKRVSFLARFCSSSQRSIIGRNLSCIARRLQVDHFSVKCAESRKKLKHAYVSELSEQELSVVSGIKDIMGCLSNECVLPNFRYNELENILKDLCEN